MILPDGVAKKLVKSISQDDEGLKFELTNPLMNVTIRGMERISIDENPIDKKNVILRFENMEKDLGKIEDEGGVKFKVGSTVEVVLRGWKIDSGDHTMKFTVLTKEFGRIDMKVPLKI